MEKTSLKLGLDIGCGPYKFSAEGFQILSLDIRGEAKPDIIAPVDKIPTPDENFDLVYASHVLEHVKRADVGTTLKEWRRVLKTGGTLMITVPDLEVAAIELLSCKTHSETFDILWGMQEHPYSFHYSGYTKYLLEATVKKFGFEISKLETHSRQIFMTATKLKGEYFGEEPKEKKYKCNCGFSTDNEKEAYDHEGVENTPRFDLLHKTE